MKYYILLIVLLMLVGCKQSNIVKESHEMITNEFSNKIYTQEEIERIYTPYKVIFFRDYIQYYNDIDEILKVNFIIETDEEYYYTFYALENSRLYVFFNKEDNRLVAMFNVPSKYPKFRDFNKLTIGSNNFNDVKNIDKSSILFEPSDETAQTEHIMQYGIIIYVHYIKNNDNWIINNIDKFPFSVREYIKYF